MVNVAITTENAAMTLSLMGRLDGDAAARLRPAVERLAAEAPRRLVVDLRGVGFLDGAGLGAIAYLAKRLGRRLSVTGAQGQPLALLNHLGLAPLFGLPQPAPAARASEPMAALAWGTAAA